MQTNWLKKFGRAQNILGPVKGQGIKVWIFPHLLVPVVLEVPQSEGKSVQLARGACGKK